MKIEDIMALAPVIPVIEIADADAVLPLARALLAGGLGIAEITLRTPAALEAVTRMKQVAPNLVVGAGTVLNPEQGKSAMEAGADFLVSPGAFPRLLDSATTWAIPILPGVATASEAMAALDRGFSRQKFFPAEAAGGIAYLKALGGPLPDIVFCPTGGIGPERVQDYLALANVACVGGSWIAPKASIEKGEWTQIEANARRAAAPGSLLA